MPKNYKIMFCSVYTNHIFCNYLLIKVFNKGMMNNRQKYRSLFSSYAYFKQRIYESRELSNLELAGFNKIEIDDVSDIYRIVKAEK